MNKRNFNKIIRSLCDKKTGLLSEDAMDSLDNQTKDSLVLHIVRNRQPIVKNLISNTFDLSWLHSMGYLYESRGKYFTFIHTSEQKVI